MGVKKCTVCNIKIDKANYKKDRNTWKNCYKMNRKKYNENTFSRIDNNKKERKVFDSVKINDIQKKGKVVDSVNKNNRTLIIGFSNCGQFYLMNYFLF